MGAQRAGRAGDQYSLEHCGPPDDPDGGGAANRAAADVDASPAGSAQSLAKIAAILFVRLADRGGRIDAFDEDLLHRSGTRCVASTSPEAADGALLVADRHASARDPR